MVRVGLIGFGYWGPNLARTLTQTRNCKFVGCCDVRLNNLEKFSLQYPGLEPFVTADDMWDKVDAVVIATPISTHFNLAREALQRGKHVLVEKPLAHSANLAWQLAQLAARERLTLMTGHTFIYSPPVIKVKQIIQSGALGDVYYISFSRVNLGQYQKDVDVIWDLAVHDVSILLYWLKEMPVWGASFGRACVQRDRNDVAFIWLRFPSGVIASVEISWLSPQKMRRTAVIGSNQMIVYDDTEPSEKIRVYDKGVVLHEPRSFGEFQLTYRIGDMVSPNLSNTEPLSAELEHFLECIHLGQQPTTDGAFGARVVEVLETATRQSVESTLTRELAVLNKVA